MQRYSNGSRTCVNKHTFRQLQHHLSEKNSTKQLAADVMLIDVLLWKPGRDGKSVAIDFSILTSAAESYCKDTTACGGTSRGPKGKYILTVIQGYGRRTLQTFRVVLESGSVFGMRAQEVFQRICDLSHNQRDKADQPQRLHTSEDRDFSWLLQKAPSQRYRSGRSHTTSHVTRQYTWPRWTKRIACFTAADRNAGTWRKMQT